MRRDNYDEWDDRPRRGRRAARPDEQWPGEPDERDSYPGQGSHRRSGEHPEQAGGGYSDPGYGSRHGGAGYQDSDYGGYPGYGDAGYSDPGHGGAGYPAEPDGYGQSGGYGRPDAYPDNGYAGGGYNGQGYGGSGEHRAPAYGGSGPHDVYHDSSYPPGGYGDDGYDAPEGYGGRAGYGGQEPYGAAAGYDTGDPYASSGSRSRPGAGQADYEGLAGAQYGGGYDADYGSAYDTGAGRRRQRDPEDDFDPDSARHNGFFRGFGAPDDVGHRPPKKKRRGGAGMAAFLILIIFLGGVVGGGAYAYHWYTKRHADWVGSKGYGSVVVQVKTGEYACTSSLENLLVSDGVVASGSAFCNAAKTSASGGSALEPGTFKLRKHMGAALAWALITNQKSRVQTKVTVVDGLRVSRVLTALAKATGIPYSQFESAAKDTSALGLPSWAKGNLEGFLYPATYFLQPGQTSALSILQMLVKQATTEFNSINLAAKAKTAGFTEYQVIIEASLLEAEVGPKYYTKVARVIDNRLNSGMTLGLDSTVAYALNKYIYDLSKSDLNVNSPYNTTLHTGLPPGPIDSPDLTAINAVLHPARTSDLYFVTVNKQGLTLFTSDQAQFQTWSNEAKAHGV